MNKYKLTNFSDKLIKRFNQGYTVKDDCWEWKGRKGIAGYAFIGLNNLVAHRVSWVLHNQQDWPEGLEASHLCHNKGCVNPVHVIPSTHQANMALNKGRSYRNEIDTPNGKFDNIQMAATHYGISIQGMRQRIKANPTLYKSLKKAK